MSQDFESPEPTPQDDPPKKSGPKLKIPVPPDLPDHDPEHGSPHRRLSTMVGLNMLMLLTTLALLGYSIYSQDKRPPATVAEKGADKGANKGADDVKPDVDRLRDEIKDLAKKLEAQPTQTDAQSWIKLLDGKIADLSKTMADMPGRFDSLGQKLEAVSKDAASSPKVDAIERRIGELGQSLDAIKADLAAKPAATTPTTLAPAAAPAAASNGDTQAMDQAIDLFKKGKYAEANEAFAKLQTALPEDARVWYFSALANGLATRDWKGETERLVTTGMAKEKAGTPDRSKIDAAFSDLTATTGKAWLAYYRGRAAQ